MPLPPDEVLRHPGLLQGGPDQPHLQEVVQVPGERRLLCQHGRESHLVDYDGRDEDDLGRPVVVIQ